MAVFCSMMSGTKNGDGLNGWKLEQPRARKLLLRWLFQLQPNYWAGLDKDTFRLGFLLECLHMASSVASRQVGFLYDGSGLQE